MIYVVAAIALAAIVGGAVVSRKGKQWGTGLLVLGLLAAMGSVWLSMAEPSQEARPVDADQESRLAATVGKAAAEKLVDGGGVLIIGRPGEAAKLQKVWKDALESAGGKKLGDVQVASGEETDPLPSGDFQVVLVDMHTIRGNALDLKQAINAKPVILFSSGEADEVERDHLGLDSAKIVVKVGSN